MFGGQIKLRPDWLAYAAFDALDKPSSFPWQAKKDGSAAFDKP